MRIKTTFALVALFTVNCAFAQDVRIGVLGLFHPHQLTLTTTSGSALVVHAGPESFVLDASANHKVQIQLSLSSIRVNAGTRAIHATTVTASGRSGETVDFTLAVPGKLTRHYRGTLEVRASAESLVAIVHMDLETAVASVVAAEAAPDALLEALKAQAVATRSFFVAGKGRHRSFDFCDTTHCQFLREPPTTDSPAFKATFATRGLVIAYESKPFAAMYTRSCSGRTHTPSERGLPEANYPYYPVDCKYCRQYPANWRSQLAAEDAATLRSSDESSRLRIDRRLGWSAVPSDTFTVHREGTHVVLEGVGEGHGIGLCQAGAKAMAHEGATFREILSHYYPNTTIVDRNLVRELH